MSALCKVFDIQRCSFVDGPGIRTTVFLKGCNLRCKWCHNPESWIRQPQILFYENKCTHCGKCAEVCPTHATDAPSLCILCGSCVKHCPSGARELCGEDMTADQLFDLILKDKSFFSRTNGGVTFSGGECMLQADALVPLLQMCRNTGIHTAIDTAGNVPFSEFEKVL